MAGKVFDDAGLRQLEAKFDKLDESKRNNILYSSLIRGARVLVTEGQSQLKMKMGASATRPVRNQSGGSQYAPLVDGIHISSKDKSYCEVNVTILRRTGGYLHWYEKGTAIRKTKAGYNRGQINALNFFLAARNASQAPMNNVILNNIDRQIRKIVE